MVRSMYCSQGDYIENRLYITTYTYNLCEQRLYVVTNIQCELYARCYIVVICVCDPRIVERESYIPNNVCTLYTNYTIFIYIKIGI